MKKIFLLLLGVITCMVFVLGLVEAQKVSKQTIAITQIVEHPALNKTRAGIIDELNASELDFSADLNFIYESAQGSSLLAAQIAQKFSGMRPAVVVAIGTPSAQALVAATKRNRVPLVFSSVTDPIEAQLVRDMEVPGQNVTGVSNYIDAEPQIRFCQKVLPGLKTIGIVYNPGEINSVQLVKIFTEAAEALGVEIKTTSALKTTEVSTAIASLANKVDALFVTNDNVTLAAFDSVVGVAKRLNIPVFVSDVDIVDRGAIAALGPNQYELGRQTGRMIARILNGEDPGSLQVGLPEITESWLNLDVAAELEIELSETLVQEADVLIGSPRS